MAAPFKSRGAARLVVDDRWSGEDSTDHRTPSFGASGGSTVH